MGGNGMFFFVKRIENIGRMNMRNYHRKAPEGIECQFSWHKPKYGFMFIVIAQVHAMDNCADQWKICIFRPRQNGHLLADDVFRLALF